MTNTHPKNIERKRKGGRPCGVKERQRRKRHERVVPPADLVWHDKREAAGRLGVSVSLIDKNLDDIGFVFLGDRRVAHVDDIDAWALRGGGPRRKGERDEPRAAP